MSIEAEFLSAAEAAKYLGVHRETVYGLILDGAIRASKIGGRWRIPKASLDSYLLHGPLHPVRSRNKVDLPPRSRPIPLQVVPARQEHVTPQRILVIDDNPHVLDLFRVVLVRRGHLVTLAQDGNEAIERVKTEHYDMIFIDLLMPEPNGVDTLKAIKSIDPGPRIVLITGHLDGDLVTKALETGPFVILGKPIRVDDLLKVIER